MEPKSTGRSSAQLSNADHLDAGNRPVWSVCDQPILEHCRFWALSPDVRHRRNGFKIRCPRWLSGREGSSPSSGTSFIPSIKNAPEALGSAAQGHFLSTDLRIRNSIRIAKTPKEISPPLLSPQRDERTQTTSTQADILSPTPSMPPGTATRYRHKTRLQSPKSSPKTTPR